MEKKITAFYGTIAKGQEEKIRKIEKGMELARKRIAEAFEKSKKEYPIDSMIKRLMEKKEFAVGEEFQMGLKKFRCIGVMPLQYCSGCCFVGKRCLDIRDLRGPCSSRVRKDGEDVIFVEVE